MATEILAVAATELGSADLTIADGESITVCLKDPGGPTIDPGAAADIQIKDDAGQYFTVAKLTGSNPALILSGPGTYRIFRPGGIPCGVFRA